MDKDNVILKLIDFFTKCEKDMDNVPVWSCSEKFTIIRMCERYIVKACGGAEFAMMLFPELSEEIYKLWKDEWIDRLQKKADTHFDRYKE